MKPYMECPSFNVCSANRCPLDPDIEERNFLVGEEKCRAEKPTRVKIAKKYTQLLPMKGFTPQEWVGVKTLGSKLLP